MAVTVTVRCYCHGLGDCMLVTIAKGANTAPFRILIDCGIHSAAKGGSEIVRKVAEDIVASTAGKIDAIVGTHEHWDHLSGFTQAKDELKDLEVDEVWFSWAEHPDDPQAERLDRYKGEVANALWSSASLLGADAKTQDLANGINALLGFVGMSAKGDKVRAAREELRGMAKGRVRKFEPGDIEVPAGVEGVRIYVLGPPRDEALLGIEDIPAETYSLSATVPSVAPLANGLALNAGDLAIDKDPAAPFDGSEGVALNAPKDRRGGVVFTAEDLEFLNSRYLGKDEQWRRIDRDWLTGAADLALQLDSRTNNSSLVLAIELIESKRVLLFAADAQIGSWKSWPNLTFDLGSGTQVSGNDLLARTVFYKVGHHGSRNATWKDGLERMDAANLVAFSPTDEKLAGRIGWADFPAPNTTERIMQLTSGRFLKADDEALQDGVSPFAKGGALSNDPVAKEFAQVDIDGTTRSLMFVDLVFEG